MSSRTIVMGCSSVVLAISASEVWICSGQIAALSGSQLEHVRGGCVVSGTDNCPTGTASCFTQGGGACQPNGVDENGFTIFMCGNGMLTQLTQKAPYALADGGELCGQMESIPSGGTYYCTTLRACTCKAIPANGPLTCAPGAAQNSDPRQPTVPAGGVCPPEGCNIASLPPGSQYAVLASLNGLAY